VFNSNCDGEWDLLWDHVETCRPVSDEHRSIGKGGRVATDLQDDIEIKAINIIPPLFIGGGRWKLGDGSKMVFVGVMWLWIHPKINE
jgi:hypothetical protein